MSRRKSTIAVAGILAFFLVFAFGEKASFAINRCFYGRVVAVTDGDTIKVMNRGRAERIKLAGIDCPEKGQAFVKRAKQFTAGLSMDQEVTVETAGLDRYGRILGQVILQDGRNLNHELLRAGYAWWYRQFSKDDSLREMEEEARSSRRGLWRDPYPVPPWKFRRQ